MSTNILASFLHSLTQSYSFSAFRQWLSMVLSEEDWANSVIHPLNLHFTFPLRRSSSSFSSASLLCFLLPSRLHFHFAAPWLASRLSSASRITIEHQIHVKIFHVIETNIRRLFSVFYYYYNWIAYKIRNNTSSTTSLILHPAKNLTNGDTDTTNSDTRPEELKV